ncbi:MAG: 4-hydroxybutyrate dehydrogenase [bacterium]|nr:4-hydroxybutyrate dehydrogenase [bacterium]
MKQFSVKPTIKQFDTVTEFLSEYKIGQGDLVFASGSTYGKFLKEKVEGATVINYRNYGAGEPTDLMVEGIYNDIKDLDYARVFAIGGGTILDVAKLFALKNISPVVDLYDKKLEIAKEKELILVPTTCGTGSEVTNISILELTTKNTKMGLAVEELYADDAVLIPELLHDLPFKFFATSSIDALIHSIESFTSPKANPFTKMFSLKAMELILEAYKVIVRDGEEARIPLLGDLLVASTYAGIAFGNAGCAAVHAMSYPLGAAYHVAHGEANYAMFTGVYKTYQKLDPNGSITELNTYLAGILGCKDTEVYEEIETLLNHIITKKPLHEYGVKEEELEVFTTTVMEKQGRLMANNYVELTRDTVLAIYKELY